MLPTLVLLASVARFEHARGPGAEACPDAQEIATRLEDRLGRSPFDADSPRKVSVRFEADEGKLRATIEDSERPPRVLEEEGSDCASLADRAVAALVDLFPPEPPPPPPPASPAPAPAPPPPPATMFVEGEEPPPPRPAVGPRLGAGVLAGAGFAPTANAGFFLFGGLAFPSWSIDVEGRLDLPATEETRDFTVRTALRLAQVVVCTRKGPAFGCAIAGGGVLAASSGNENDAKSDTFFHGHVGVRVGIESQVVGPLALRVAFDVLLPVTRATIEVGGNEAWITPPVGFAFGAGPTLRF